MNVETVDVEGVFRDFRDCLNTFDEWAKSFWSFSALDVEQVFKVGDDVALVAPVNRSLFPSSTVATCQATGTLTLVHMFQSTRFVPIGNTPVIVQRVDPNGGPLGEPLHKTIGPSGILEVTECDRNQQYRVSFYPNVSQDHLKALYTSYHSVITALEARLRKEWTDTFQAQWKNYTDARPLERRRLLEAAFVSGLGKALYSLWDNIGELSALLADLKPNSEKLLHYLSQTELDELLTLGSDAIAQGLLVLSDEPLLFIYLSALVSWMRMLPPPEMAELWGEITGEVLINLLLIRVLGGMGVVARLGAGVLSHVKSGRARALLELLAKQVVGPRLETHVEVAKPVLLSSAATPVKVAPVVPLKAGDTLVSNPVPMVRGKTQRTTLVRQEPVDDVPAVASNPKGDAAAPADKTVTHGCPVSMVTGEELLTLTDSALDGILPFEWTRLYRTSAVEAECGLGFGWSHALAHRLVVSGDSVVWTDHENRSTTLPLPTVSRPAITNSLAEAAIYLGASPDELVLAQASRFYHFRDGVLTTISDAYDNRLRLCRDRSGRIERLDNGAGRSLLLRYELDRIVAVDYQVHRAKGREPYVWETEQNIVSYAYDEAGRLVCATNAVGESERYRYDDQHVIVERQLAGGASFFWAWEGAGKAARCVRHWASFSQMDTRYAWGDDGRVTVHNADGSQEVYVHDDRARLVQRIDPDGAQHYKSYDDKGRLTVEQDPMGAVTAYQYDDAGRLVALFPGDDEPTSYEHDNGFVRVVRRGEAVWKYERNEQGDVTRRTDPDGEVTDYSYNKHGQLTGVWYPDHSCHRLVWNERGQLLEEQLPNGGIKRYRYDDLGRQVACEDEHGALTHYHWDCVGRLIRLVLPGGATREFSYNPYGKIIAERDELGHVTRYEYADGLHLISRRLNADGTQVKYRYDNARLLLTEIENEAGETYQLDYHPNGLIRQETGFDGQRTAYAYDLNGHLLEKTEYGDDGSQLITRYERDHAGRLVRKTLPDASVVDYAYDRQGNLLSVEDGHWALAYEYDRQNRLTAEHQGWGTLRYGYDACGQLKNLCLPDNNRVTFTHDKGGHLATVELNGEVLTSHLFKSGREHQRQQGQLLSHYHYDDQNRLHAHAVTQQQNYLYQRQYDYDKSGNLTRLLDTRKGEHLYRYDPLNRLTRADHSQDVQERFAHNPAGNLLMQDRPGPDIVAANRLMIQGDRHYDYDAFGNLIRERRGKSQQLVTEYRYDCQHRLISITKPNGETASYRYDPFGRRISKTVDGKTTEFFWQGDKLIAEHHAERHRSYLYEPDSFRPLALLEGFGAKETKPYHYQLDHLGTPQELTNPEGEIVWSAHYRAYGQIARLDVGNIDNPLRFQGQYFDAESGLHYNRHRYYNPDIGRYLTPDPVRLAGGINGYRYVPNPTGWVDQLGLSTCPGADGCTPHQRTETSHGQAKVDEGAPSLPSSDKKREYLFRGDLREPDEIFERGFESRGASTDLFLHTLNNASPPSNFVPTSTSRKQALVFASNFGFEEGFLYTLKKIPGINVNKALGARSKHRNELEIAIPGRIDTKDILGASPVNEDGTFKGYTILNPNRKYP
ncbi:MULTISPECIES: RHS repeat-associated core domain-containing protein [Pseudomonas]|nr:MULTISPECIES: RHS repeat-associated core domain-containing protein [Pseudomonas]MBV2083089.1 RHS domain-containing protein [Pseudomonas carnis]MBV2088689.1 RHS domain-containing protein [Pseudomonas carnis]MDO3692802.1 RHS repeat-associated core domain-containing protein [Pseudomonas sp. DKN 2791]MDO7034812.1 RHS repeat-associated core domain-containing protein [Pseudomonas sp. DKN 2792]CAH0286226.1 Putative deoxyribonuclease RhsC [Pseudomonas carnis]